MKRREFLQNQIRSKPPLPTHRLRAEGKKYGSLSGTPLPNMRGEQSAKCGGTQKAAPHCASFVLQDVFDVSSKGTYPSVAGTSFSVFS
jgi:hypothetical protein